MANQYPPTLNVPVSKSFRDLDEVQVTLRYDEPKEFEGKFGPQFKYSVDVDGTEHTLFASPALNRQIQDHSPTTGSVLSIARVGSGKETKWDVVYVSGPKGTGDNRRSEKPATGSGRSEPARSAGPDPKGYTDELARYWLAFDLAIQTLIQRGMPHNVDANAIAFVIYKMAKEHGIEDPSNPGTPATPSTDTEEAERGGKSKMRMELERLFKDTGLSEEDWLTVVNLHRAEDQPEISMWDDVTRDVGLAVFATAKSVESGVTTWDAVMGTEDQDALPF